MNRRFIALLLISAAFVAPSFAQDPGKKDEAKTPAEKAPQSVADRLKALEQEMQKDQEEFGKKWNAAKTEEERQKVAGEYPGPDRYLAKYVEIFKGNEADPAIVPAIEFLIGNAEVEVGQPAIDALMKHHLKSKDIGGACLALSQRGGNIATKTLKEVYAANPHKEVKGRALWGLCQMAKAANSEKDVVAICGMIQKDFADIELYPGTKLGDLAKGELFEIQNLGIGKAAPEIEGVDAEGVKFKLSDYRGKVVMLDFWGFW